jgi:ATP adenylyltransferase
VAKKKSKVAKPKSSAKKSPVLKLAENIWPLERDVLFRPDRYKYVRKLIKPQGCVFCVAAKKGPSFETLCIKKTKHSMLVLNKFPYNSGHLLVIPERHVANLEDLTADEFNDLHQLLKTAVAGLKQVYQPGGFNIGLNLGSVAGAGIPEHIHYHVIPRWAGDLNFFPLIAETKAVVESLEMTYERLLSCYS